MKRVSQWQKPYNEFLRARRDMPFEWGANDCCLFACDCIKAITGVDPAVDYRGYTAEHEANTKIAMFGTMEALIESIAHRSGMPEVAPKYAKRGDVALCEFDGKQVLCVIGPDGWPVGPSERGTVKMHRGSMRRAWGVG